VSIPFAEVVKKAFAAQLPAYRFVRTTKGNGPILTFERPSLAAAPRLRANLELQKGLHGGNWFRVNFRSECVGQSKGGTEAGYSVYSPDHPTSLRDVSFEDRGTLEANLKMQMQAIEAEWSKRMAPLVESYSKLDRLFGTMIERYATWIRGEGSVHPPEAFRVPDTDGSGNGNVPAFLAFVRFLDREKLVVAPTERQFPPTIDGLFLDLWAFWIRHRPERRGEFTKSKLFISYFDCATCGKWGARGEPVPRADPHFGEYFEFRCSTCSKA
jgi:hypothetical protein